MMKANSRNILTALLLGLAPLASAASTASSTPTNDATSWRTKRRPSSLQGTKSVGAINWGQTGGSVKVEKASTQAPATASTRGTGAKPVGPEPVRSRPVGPVSGQPQPIWQNPIVVKMPAASDSASLTR